MGKDKSKSEWPAFLMPPLKIEIREGAPEPDFVKKVDEFIERYYNGDYVINRYEAFHIPYGIEGKVTSLGHYLSFYITNYVVSKSKTLEERYGIAYMLFSLITHAFATSVIKDGDGLVTKLKKYEEQVKLLREEIDKLGKKCLILEKENKELHKALDLFGGRGIVE